MIVHEAVTDDEDQADSMDEVEALGEENERSGDFFKLASGTGGDFKRDAWRRKGERI